MKKIPTAEEFIEQLKNEFPKEAKMSTKKWMAEVAIRLAKLHVKAALEAAAKEARLSLNGSDVPYVEHYEKDGNSWTVNEKTILEAYPLDNIK